MHSKCIAHRDLKPENFLLNQNLKLVIADFGCAAVCRTETSKLIEFDSSQIVGSLEYNPPEYNMDKTYTGEKFDIFGLGVWCFLMIVGYQPFRKASSEDDYFKMFVKDKMTFWTIYNAVQVSPEFKDFFEKLCEPNAEKRLSLVDIKSHPWVTGPVYSDNELADVMKDRIDLLCNMSKREIQEKFENHKYQSFKSMSHMQMESGYHEKLVCHYLSEMESINDILVKKRLEIAEEAQQQHSSSDDQANSLSDDGPETSKEELKSPSVSLKEIDYDENK